MLKLIVGAARLAGWATKNVAKGGWIATKGVAKLGHAMLFDTSQHFNMKTQAVGLVLSLGIGAMMRPDNRIAGAATEGAYWIALAGARNPFTQIAGSIGLSLMTSAPDIAKGVANSYVGGLDARTAATVPFSHSNVATDIAAGQLQYAQQRIHEMSSPSTGTEAMFFSAKMAR